MQRRRSESQTFTSSFPVVLGAYAALSFFPTFHFPFLFKKILRLQKLIKEDVLLHNLNRNVYQSVVPNLFRGDKESLVVPSLNAAASPPLYPEKANFFTILMLFYCLKEPKKIL